MEPHLIEPGTETKRVYLPIRPFQYLISLLLSYRATCPALSWLPTAEQVIRLEDSKSHSQTDQNVRSLRRENT